MTDVHVTHGIERLLIAVQELSLARTLDDITGIVRTAARDLTGCDGATFVLRDNGKCYYVDEDAIEPLWRGSRFPMEACISGWAMLNKQPAVISDIYEDPRIPHEAYRPTFVQSLAMVLIRSMEPIGAIGNYWAEHHEATDDEVRLLQALADSTSVAMENVSVWSEIAEVTHRADGFERDAITDDLTGLLNRRGFMLEADQCLLAARTAGRPAAVMFVDLDGLKLVNDFDGHDAGDQLIARAGQALSAAVGEGDVVARLGGDEFCALVVDEPRGLVERLQRALAGVDVKASIGVVEDAAVSKLSLAQLMTKADTRMYANKQSRRSQLV